MTIDRVKASNIKNFESIDLKLGNFNVFIGSNASGKSNFVSIFRFIKDLSNNDLHNVISMHGGIDYLRNLSLGNSIPTSITISSNTGFKSTLSLKDYYLGVDCSSAEYSIKISYEDDDSYLSKDKFRFNCSLFELERKNSKLKEKKNIGKGLITYTSSKGKINISISKNLNIDKNILTPFWKLPSETLIRYPLFPLIFEGSQSLINISIYDIDPKLPKKAIPITGKVDLEENGNNLALALNQLIRNKSKLNKLNNIIKDLLPFVEDVDIAKLEDKSILFKLKERYFKKGYLPATFISDGTINLLAIILILFIEESDVAIIEEPERNIHPHLISSLIDLMKDASSKKQIIITTHNPEIIRHAGIDNIYLISRTREGRSDIFKPKTKKQVRHFLKNDIGIEELFIDNMLQI